MCFSFPWLSTLLLRLIPIGTTSGTRPHRCTPKFLQRQKRVIVCKPRTDIRIDVSGIVIRVRIRDTAIRIRIVVRPIDHTGPLGKSAFLFISYMSLRVEGRTWFALAPRFSLLASLVSPIYSTACIAINADTDVATLIFPLKASREPKYALT